MNNKNKLILEWLQDNISDFVKYYPNTKKVKLKNGTHITLKKLFRKVTSEAATKPKRKYTRKLKNTDK